MIADASAAHLDRARELASATPISPDAGDAAEGADLVIAAVPVGACEAVAKAIAPRLKAGAIVSDVGSVKGSVIGRCARIC